MSMLLCRHTFVHHNPEHTSQYQYLKLFQVRKQGRQVRGSLVPDGVACMQHNSCE